MTGSVVPPTTISDEAVEAVAELLWLDGLSDWAHGSAWADAVPMERDYAIRTAARLLARAVPYIEAGLREALAAEIEALVLDGTTDTLIAATNAGVLAAARVARGTQEATK